MPSLTAPEAEGTTSRFKTISTETIPLTRTQTVKFRQTLHDIPVYGSLVTVELDESNALVSLDSTLGTPEGVDPVADVSPAAGAAPLPSRPGRLHAHLDGRRTQAPLLLRRRRLDLAAGLHPRGRAGTLDRGDESAADGQRPLEPPRFVDYVVDAHGGDVVAVLPRTPSVASGEEQTAVDAFGVERTFLASKNEDGQAGPASTRSTTSRPTTSGSATRPTEPGLPGDDVVNPPDWSAAAVSGHANAVAVSEFMHTVLMRNNIDDQGGAMVSTVNCVVVDASDGPQEWHNAFWTGQLKQMVYGQVRRGGRAAARSRPTSTSWPTRCSTG